MQKTKYREDKYVRCPCYHKESATAIKCDSCCGGSCDMTVFRSEHAKDEYKEDFCAGNYLACPKYQTIAEDDDGT